ncbi:hypothetical protein [Coleofasciculus sp. G2-EDA-02]
MYYLSSLAWESDLPPSLRPAVGSFGVLRAMVIVEFEPRGLI